jgi:hypothetical protein
VEFQKRYADSPEEKTIEDLHRFWSARYNIKQLTNVVKRMVDAGHRYKNIDKELGDGSFLVLGKDLSETT